MKWKCNNCMYGPCVYESYNCREYDDINPKIEKCPRGMFAAIWLMSDEEPEQKRNNGLPEWLKVGNFVVFDKNKIVVRIDGYDVNEHTISLSGRNIFGKPYRNDIHCLAGWGEARVVFPRPYTFETAPEILKVRRKEDGMKDIMRLKLSAKNGAYWDDMFGYRSILYDELLQKWEQLDGWPCGTFDEEEK